MWLFYMLDMCNETVEDNQDIMSLEGLNMYFMHPLNEESLL